MKRCRAFSLLELSVVLAVLALLAGGIMGGKALIRQSELLSVTNNIVKYKAAYNTFKTQYGGAPGDIVDATSYWGSAGGDAHKNDATCDAALSVANKEVCNGDANGQVSENKEQFYAWKELSNAGLIEGSFRGRAETATSPVAPDVDAPAEKSADAIYGLRYVTPQSGSADFFDGAYGFNVLSLKGVAAQSYAFTAAEAYGIDKKMDDGRPATGQVFVGKNTVAGAPQCATSTDYNLESGGKLCNLFAQVNAATAVANSTATGGWTAGTCSKTCDDGIVSGSVCTGGNGACAGPSYDGTACNLGACPVNGQCHATNDNACAFGAPTAYAAGACGGSSTWTCAGTNGGTNVNCNHANAACPPPTGTWTAGSCSATCGGGTINAPICSGGNGVCDPATRPTSGTACNPQVCASGTWTPGTCSATCGGGIISGSVCSGGNGICTGSSNDGTACNTQACGPVNGMCSVLYNICTVGTPSGGNPGACDGSATWTCQGANGGTSPGCTHANPACSSVYTGTWGTTCSASCGGGTIGVPICSGGNSLCDPSTKPVAGTACNTDVCGGGSSTSCFDVTNCGGGPDGTCVTVNSCDVVCDRGPCTNP